MKKRVIHISKDREARLPITVEEKSLRQTHNVTLNVCLLHLHSPKAGSGLSSASEYADDNLNGIGKVRNKVIISNPVCSGERKNYSGTLNPHITFPVL